MTDADHAALLAAARRARDNAHAPYSGFRVGAAVKSRSGAVYLGCNVENASYGATTCAERNAVAAMVAAGERDIDVIAVCTDSPTLTMPCGICRQVIIEFGKTATVVTANANSHKATPITELLPDAFAFTP